MRLPLKTLTTIFLSIAPTIALANNYSIGQPTHLNLDIWNTYQPYSSIVSWHPEDNLLINSSSQDIDSRLIEDALNNDVVLIIDNTDLNEKDRMMHVSKLIGFGVDAPIIVAAKRSGKLRVSVLNINETNSLATTELITNHFSEVASNVELKPLILREPEKPNPLLSASINQQLNILMQDMAMPKGTDKVRAANNLYRLEKQIDLRLRQLNFACMMCYSQHGNRMMDFCDGSASIDINYNIAMIRSIVADKPGGGQTKNAKYVRISVSNDAGTGSGIHLRNSLIQDDTYNNSKLRRTRIGPFAAAYTLWVKPLPTDDGEEPVIVNKMPENQNPDYQQATTSEVSIGVNVSAGAVVGSGGPQIGAEVGAASSYSNGRSMAWDTKEYRIKNSSSGNNFEVSWERSLTHCQELMEDDGSCSFTDASADKTMWNENKYNPIVYANFVPNLDVLYEVPASRRGSSAFSLGVEVTAEALYGIVTKGYFSNTYRPDLKIQIPASVTMPIIVDWDSPVFKPEAHIRIRSLNTR